MGGFAIITPVTLLLPGRGYHQAALQAPTRLAHAAGHALRCYPASCFPEAL